MGMSPEELDAAVDAHRADRLAAVSEALDRLAAAAEDARSALYAATRDLGYRPVAAATGLPLATVQRWRVELPVQPVLRRRDRTDPPAVPDMGLVADLRRPSPWNPE